MQCQSFEPVYLPGATAMILGSMPGIVSLQAAQYYAHPRNAFWPILFEYFGEPFSEVYEDRLGLILRHKLALWDTCHTCMRDGSLDTGIREVIYNDFDRIFGTCNIGTVLCNGQKAFSLFKRSGSAGDRNVICLPSTSPAYTLSYEEKRRRWQEALDMALSSRRV